MLDWPGRFARMRDAATSFALQEEQPVQGGSIGSRDIIAFCPELQGLYIVVDGAVRSRGDGEVPIGHQAVKDSGNGVPSLGIGRTGR